jgi:hypothetical protein
MSKRKAIGDFKEKYHLTFPVGKAKGVAKELRVETIPEALFISVGRKIVKRIKGTMNFQELINGIEEIVPATD